MPNLEETIAHDWPPNSWADVTVLVAVSGGADSMALLRAVAHLKQAGQGSLFAAHFNHQLRAQASQQDEELVRETCSRIGVELVCGQADVATQAQVQGDGIEAAARAARYKFFIETAQQRGARYLATAHTADDQAETILHRILRGTAIRGLCGIPRLRQLNDAVTLIRPMLQIGRSEVLQYLSEIKQEYREDETNRDLKFTRNRIRHELLPHLTQQYNPQVCSALQQLGHLASEAQAYVQQQVQSLAESTTVELNTDSIVLDCDQLAATSPYLVRELLVSLWSQQQWPEQAMGYTQWNLLVAMIDPKYESPTIQTLPGNIRAEKKDGKLTLSRL